MASKKSHVAGGTPTPKQQPPVHIPLSFEQAVEGLLGVKPEPKQPKKKAAKKRRQRKE